MSTDEIQFSAILCSKLCHDLVSPVGAISNGLEILADETDPEMIAQVAELLSKSTAQTANRLQFFRAAFGSGSSVLAANNGAVEVTLRDVLADKNVSLEWDIDNTSLPAADLKLLINMGMIAGDGLIRGGSVRVGKSEESDEHFLVAAQGQRLIYDAAIEGVLTGSIGLNDLEPRFAGVYVAKQLAHEGKRAIKFVQISEQESHFQTVDA